MAKEATVVHQYAYQFVENIAYREDIWAIYDEVQRMIVIIEESKAESYSQFSNCF